MIFDQPHNIDPRSAPRRFPFAPGAPTVVLLHGLTATPHQYDELAPLLYARGRNVLVPRLPRHGYHDRMTRALSDLEIAEMIASVKLMLQDAREMGEPVTVAGFSLGGLLAAYVAQREMVGRAVCISPFLGVRWLPRSVNRVGNRILDYVPDIFLWWNPLKRRHHGAGDGYPRYPISAVREALELTTAVFEDAAVNPPLTRSIAIVTNPREATCHNGLAHDLAELWRRHGATVNEFELPGLGLSHDFMTPRRGRETQRKRAYPVIVDAIIG